MSTKFKKTGAIWYISIRNREQLVSQVCKKLELAYGKPRLGNPKKPLDDLIFIIISNKTTPSQAFRVYEELKVKYVPWSELLAESIEILEKIVAPSGLAKIKTSQIIGALGKIANDFGDCNLDHLINFSEEEQLIYLTSLPGASGKVARCVMLFTLGIPVLPVDSHVHRVSRRLGWTARKRADQCHEELEALIPLDNRYVYHVCCIEHGRKVCRPRHPACEQCQIKRYCKHYLRFVPKPFRPD